MQCCEASSLLLIPFFHLCFPIFPFHSLSSPSLLLSLCVFLQRLPAFEHHTLLTYWPSTPCTQRERTTGKVALRTFAIFCLIALLCSSFLDGISSFEQWILLLLQRRQE